MSSTESDFLNGKRDLIDKTLVEPEQLEKE